MGNGKKFFIGEGLRNNQFQQRRSYIGFVKNHLEELQNWSTSFFKNDQEIVYHVSRASIRGKYDFKQKGYWLRTNPPFLAYTENEGKLKNGEVLLPILSSKAKEFGIKTGTPIFAVFKGENHSENHAFHQYILPFGAGEQIP